MSRVPKCVEWLECPSALSTRMTECLQSAQIEQNFRSLFLRINKSVRNTAIIRLVEFGLIYFSSHT